MSHKSNMLHNPTPLPINQIMCVIFVQICESLNINVLFPFLAFMVEDFGYTGDNLGYYAGYLAAAFCAAQFFSSIVWGIISDRYGRKSAIVLGVLGGAVGMLVFGFSKTYTQAVCGRMLSGFLSGNLGVLKSYLTEITDNSNRGAAFSYMTLAWSIGTVVAPLAGGLLSRPSDKFPKLFSESYPYLLPCLLCVCFNIFSSMFCVVFMIESKAVESTKGKYASVAWADEESDDTSKIELVGGVVSDEDSKVNSPKSVAVEIEEEEDTFSTIELAEQKKLLFDDFDGHHRLTSSSTSTVDCSATDDEFDKLVTDSSTKSSGSVLLQRDVLITTSLYGVLCLAYILYDETLPLFLKQDGAYGGFAFSSTDIGLVLSICGVAMLFFSAFALPRVASLSKLWTLKVACLTAVPVALVWPALGLFRQALEARLARHLSPPFIHDVIMAILIVVCLCKYILSCIAFTSSMILISHSVPDQDLGKVNGLGQSLGALARAVGPALGGIFWSLGLQLHFIFANFTLVAVVLLLCVFVNSLLSPSLDSKLSFGNNDNRPESVIEVEISI